MRRAIGFILCSLGPFTWSGLTFSISNVDLVRPVLVFPSNPPLEYGNAGAGLISLSLGASRSRATDGVGNYRAARRNADYTVASASAATGPMPSLPAWA